MTFFLHWDEVGTIEGSAFTHYYSWEGTGDLSTRMKRYYELWSEISPLLRIEGLYMFVTDRRPAFAMIGLGMLPSFALSSLHRHLVIGGLQPNAIVETFQLSTLAA